MEAKGKTLLKVCGVLFIIEGIIGIIAYGLMTILLSVGTVITKNEIQGSVGVVAIAALYVVAAVVSLIAGILGVKNAANKDAAKKCLVWGVINLVLTLAAGIWSLIGEGITLFHILYTCIGLIIPSLYIAGAYINK